MRFVLLLGLLISGCASVPDVPVCTEIHMSKGWCTNTVSDVEFFIYDKNPHSFSGNKKDAKTWWELRPFMVYMPFESYAEFKKYIIKQCKRTNCDKYIKSWDRRILQMEKKVLED